MAINSYELIDLWPSKLETKHDEWKKCFKPQFTERQTKIEFEGMRRDPVSCRVAGLTREHQITNPVS